MDVLAVRVLESADEPAGDGTVSVAELFLLTCSDAVSVFGLSPPGQAFNPAEEPVNTSNDF